MYQCVSADYIECAEFARQNARVDAIRAQRRQERERKAWEAEHKRSMARHRERYAAMQLECVACMSLIFLVGYLVAVLVQAVM